MVRLFGAVHTSEACLAELLEHRWDDRVLHAGDQLVVHRLTDSEGEEAQRLGERIAAHAASHDSEPDHHLGEAEAMVLAQRPDFDDTFVLLDELAARAVAQELGLAISGFAGALLLAAGQGFITADEVQQKLIQCQRQGTHYSSEFIERVYQAAREGES